jgi:hypothetical protein
VLPNQITNRIDIAHAVVTVLRADDRATIQEIEVCKTNP